MKLSDKCYFLAAHSSLKQANAIIKNVKSTYGDLLGLLKLNGYLTKLLKGLYKWD